MSGRSPRWLTGIKKGYAANFADNTWEQIIDACQRKSAPDSWAVGDQKTMTIGGADYLIDIIGKNHDDYSDETGTAPLTFQMHDCYGTQYGMISGFTAGWTKSTMRTTSLPAILAVMPAEVQNGIRNVNKLTAESRSSSTIVTTEDNLFLLSEVEITGSNSGSNDGEGTQYDYYKSGGAKVKNRGTIVGTWWTRSPSTAAALNFRYVTASGDISYSGGQGSKGVAFAFCF